MARIPKITVMLGIISFIIAYIVPYDGLEVILGPALRPLGFVTLYLNPILGIVGSGFSIYKKQWLYLLLNIVLIFSFFIILVIGYEFI
ncbi:hypothetical protein GOQ27_03680 [Clostridium sp. D2Q-11]|uniref:Uncharacterized protein n=1 Tax=Anaeromonas frigoriresistens TaxID=2683708 RepID=A0A942Z6G1_9FIRM|nr:hypothetical protein [Anaeromonas frigoriresistens]MBS4537547.1 hypothetical protein [Anaeromonas frigoriresistens]